MKDCAQVIENARRGDVCRVCVFAQNSAFDGRFAICAPPPCYRLERAYKASEGAVRANDVRGRGHGLWLFPVEGGCCA